MTSVGLSCHNVQCLLSVVMTSLKSVVQIKI